MSRVIVFGSLNMDLSIACDRPPLAGETITGRDLVMGAGRKGANQAVAAARLGAETRMIGAVGADAFGHELSSGLAADGIDTTELVCADATPTGIALIVRSEGDNRIIVEPGANHVLTAEDACAALDRAAQPGAVFVTQLECALDATLAALAHARAMGLTTIFNPAPACPLPEDTWGYVDVLCLNETECAAYTGVLPEDGETVAQAMEVLAALGAGSVVITRGAAGSDVRDARTGAIHHIPARTVKALDTTAAGDTYVGALAAALADGSDLADAAHRATFAAALAVQAAGAQASIPTLAQLEAALDA